MRLPTWYVMLTVTLGFDASGISSTCSPLASRYSRMPSTSRRAWGSLPAGVAAAALPGAGGEAAVAGAAAGAACAATTAQEMAATSARTRKGLRFFMGAYLG